MSFLVVQAYLQLTSFASCLKQRNFAAVYDRVHNYPLSTHPVTPDTVTRIRSAVDMACVWYWKETLCLQRSAATVCLLRRYGVKAQLVIATRHIPFQAHAWVEVEGKVVNDKPDVQQTYAVLDRC
jgi:Transglutaminase-like superfamily